MEYKHVPVMLEEAVSNLNIKPGGAFLDCTLGGGGYTEEIAKKVGEKGIIAAIDADDLAIKNAEQKFKNKKNIILIHDNFKSLHKIINRISEGKKDFLFDGIVFDLGLSSAQLKDSSRGFSFQFDTPLKMSFGKEGGETDEIVNKWSENEIRRVLREFGEEKFAGAIAKNIVKARKEKVIRTTGDLIKVIGGSIPNSYKNNIKIHFATRTFQALRIATNEELKNLEDVLPQAQEALKPGGRLVIISYHSLEDRIVKNFFRKESRNCICRKEVPICQCKHQTTLKIITKKPLEPTDNEIKINPRARSAKMRVAEKIK